MIYRCKKGFLWIWLPLCSNLVIIIHISLDTLTPNCLSKLQWPELSCRVNLPISIKRITKDLVAQRALTQLQQTFNGILSFPSNTSLNCLSVVILHHNTNLLMEADDCKTYVDSGCQGIQLKSDLLCMRNLGICTASKDSETLIVKNHFKNQLTMPFDWKHRLSNDGNY